MNKIFVIIALLLFSSNLVASEFGGVPNPKEILGFWKMVPLNKPEINRINPWPQPYQWFAFYDDGSFVSMAKTEGQTLTAKDLKKLFSPVKLNSPRYSWKNNYLIVEYKNMPGKYEIWGINIFRKDSRISKKGDIIMSLADGKTMKPIYFRHLTPIK